MYFIASLQVGKGQDDHHCPELSFNTFALLVPLDLDGEQNCSSLALSRRSAKDGFGKCIQHEQSLAA